MSKLTRIVAAVVDTRQMTLYKEDGTTVVIPQGDPRLRQIMEQHGEHLAMHNWADVDLTEPEESTYVDFEAKSNGVVRFFRIAKAKLKQLLGAEEIIPGDDPVEPNMLGAIPAGSDDQDEHFDPVVTPNAPPKVVQTMAAVSEIMANAVSASSADFNEVGIVQQRVIADKDGVTPNEHPEEGEDTIIAVVDNKVIPGMERIKSQFARATALGSTTGVEKFLQRLGTVIESRSHSVDDLLKFMERGDLPIADDGSILIYKALNHKLTSVESGGRNTYKDCHSGNVEQWIGAYVVMDPKLVDHNRNNECSNGLHVARRGYIRNFGGSVCVLAKLAPEDVITVPTYDANKMRVCGYHILFELSNAQYSLLKNNKPITDDAEGKVVLARAMRGDHICKTHEVRITSSMGGGVITTELTEDTAPILAPAPEARREEVALPDTQKATDAPVDLRDVNKVVERTLSRKDQAQALYDAWVASDKLTSQAMETYQALLDFKRQAKVNWDKLDIPTKDGKPVLPKQFKRPRAVVETARPSVKTLDEAMTSGSPRERIAKLLSLGLNTDVAYRIFLIKKQAKKSWEALDVSEKDLKKILKLIEI